MVVGRPVLDRTGVTTHFDVDFTFTPDDTAAGLMANWGSVQGHRESVAATALLRRRATASRAEHSGRGAGEARAEDRVH